MSTLPISPTQIVSILHLVHSFTTIPPHLLSSQLAFRQSCLNLNSDDPAYFFWPSSNDQHVLDALEQFQRKPIDDISLDFDIQYTRDESFFAHVEVIPGGLRLVFQHEGDSWKYHNAAHMPFPPSSYPSLDSVPEPQTVDEDSGSAEEDGDNYWDSYGEPAGEDNVAEEKAEVDEKSYWDLYNSVQGSGDSVIPSPVPEKQQEQERQEMYSGVDDPISSLSDRLAAISRRPPLEDEEDAITNDMMHTATDTVNSFPQPVAAISVHPPPEEENEATVPEPTKRNTPGVDALKESVRGLYRLWKVTSAETDPEAFLSLVRETLTEL
ncbi:hypothetical protein FB45DRAFT_553269 [Roridomyces roridus]|uniref:Uncharacterized protein n=1 Tax=Roridomyces roridus TaxID=1738132 RepID=A0AAD7FLN9_9AGAR|nr:hypothetical protein FB45DRAFT_553269 [Roridomyces roridus]